MNLARTAIALERCRLAQGAFPESLDALAPQFIAKVPHDVIGGKPLKYRREADGCFVLYSIGWNEKDDDGEAAFNQDGTVDIAEWRLDLAVGRRQNEECRMQNHCGRSRGAGILGADRAVGPMLNDVRVRVDAGQVVRTVDARLFGINAVMWDSYFETPETLSALRELDVQALRWPGGSPADDYHWAFNRNGKNLWTVGDAVLELHPRRHEPPRAGFHHGQLWLRHAGGSGGVGSLCQHHQSLRLQVLGDRQ